MTRNESSVRNATLGAGAARTSRSRFVAPIVAAMLIVFIAALSTILLAAAGMYSRTSDSQGVVSVFGGVGLGPGAFSYPRAVATAPDGRVFVVDKSGRVQRFAPDGTFESQWKMPETQAGKPVGLSVHPDGRVFVADTHYARVMIFDRDGNVLAAFGEYGDGPGQMRLPTDVAFDRRGFIYVSEYGGNDRITKWSPDLTFVAALAEEPIQGKRLRRPAGIAVDENQMLWIADACNHRIVRMSLDGGVPSVFGSFGEDLGSLRYPYDLALAPDGTVMVCEYQGSRLQWFTRDGRAVRTWGRPGRGPGELFAPWGAAYGADHLVYVVDSLNSRIQMIR